MVVKLPKAELEDSSSHGGIGGMMFAGGGEGDGAFGSSKQKGKSSKVRGGGVDANGMPDIDNIDFRKIDMNKLTKQLGKAMPGMPPPPPGQDMNKVFADLQKSGALKGMMNSMMGSLAQGDMKRMKQRVKDMEARHAAASSSSGSKVDKYDISAAAFRDHSCSARQAEEAEFTDIGPGSDEGVGSEGRKREGSTGCEHQPHQDGTGSDQIGGETLQQVTLKVKEARKRLALAELERLLEDDEDNLEQRARERAESDGIIFVDEIDKLVDSGDSAGGGGGGGGRSYKKGEGVQKELLSLLEGTTVDTCLGPLSMDHVLFITAGAFHKCKPTDLLPELQGRLPVRVALSALSSADFERILTETESNLIIQARALLATEGVELTVTPCAIKAIANYTADLNQELENIGARRLRTVLSAVTEDLSFSAHTMSGQSVVIDEVFVHGQMGDAAKGQDLSKYLL